jgi:hypothetical protein
MQKNCDRPTGKPDSVAPTKNCVSPTPNKTFNHASSTKHVANISPSAAQTKNHKKPTGNSDSTTQAKNRKTAHDKRSTKTKTLTTRAQQNKADPPPPLKQKAAKALQASPTAQLQQKNMQARRRTNKKVNQASSTKFCPLPPRKKKC